MNVSFNNVFHGPRTTVVPFLNISTRNSTAQDVIPIFSNMPYILLKCAYVLVSVLAIGGNGLVCLLIFKIRRMRSVVNLLIANLAVADIIADVSVYPYIFINIKKTGLDGQPANLLCGITDGLTVYFAASLVSLLTLSVLSVSRYLVINHPMKRNWRLRRSHIRWVNIFSWLLSLALIIPSGLSFKYDRVNNICWRRWATGVIPLPYFLATVLLAFVVPLSTLLSTYLSTIYTLWYKQRRRLSRTNSTSSVTMYRARVVLLLGLLILVYLVTWLPFGIHWFLSAALGYYPATVEGQIKSTRGAKLTIFIALCSTLLDPIVYAFSNKHMRKSAYNFIRGRSLNTIETCGTELERDPRR